MKKLFIIAAAVLALASCSKKVNNSELMVRSQMHRCPTAKYLDFKNGNLKWNYTPGLELKAYLDVYQTYGGEDIFDYVEAWYDEAVNEDGTINTYKVETYSTDLICPAKSLFYLYDKTGKEKYRKAMDLVKTQVDGQPRTSEGAFWHKKVYPWQIWLDGVYMAEPFYVEYVTRYYPEDKKQEAYDDIVNEFTVAAKRTFDPVTGLYRHAFDESREMFWCDKETGQSQHCWGRALGWYCMAILDVLDILPEEYAGRGELISLLQNICNTLPKYADPETGVWYQVLDQPGREGNYLEATCSAMFSYAYLKGVRMGYLDKSLQDYAVQLYDNVCKQFISTDGEGYISIDHCCSVGGLGGSSNRMGDFAYYLSEKVVSNDCKGVGPFIWASLEIEKIR